MVGWIGDTLDLKSGMLFIFLMLAYILSVSIWARPLVKNEVISLKRRRKSTIEVADV